MTHHYDSSLWTYSLIFPGVDGCVSNLSFDVASEFRAAVSITLNRRVQPWKGASGTRLTTIDYLWNTYIIFSFREVYRCLLKDKVDASAFKLVQLQHGCSKQRGCIRSISSKTFFPKKWARGLEEKGKQERKEERIKSAAYRPETMQNHAVPIHPTVTASSCCPCGTLCTAQHTTQHTQHTSEGKKEEKYNKNLEVKLCWNMYVPCHRSCRRVPRHDRPRRRAWPPA